MEPYKSWQENLHFPILLAVTLSQYFASIIGSPAYFSENTFTGTYGQVVRAFFVVCVALLALHQGWVFLAKTSRQPNTSLTAPLVVTLDEHVTVE